MSLSVKDVRKKIGMTQQRFAEHFGLNLSTLREWEQGRRNPARPITLLLMAIDRAPDLIHEIAISIRR